MVADATGETEFGPLRLEIDRSVKVEFRGAAISSDGGLLLRRELDNALGLTELAADLIADPRTGHNGRQGLAGIPSPTQGIGQPSSANYRLILAFVKGTIIAANANGESRLMARSSGHLGNVGQSPDLGPSPRKRSAIERDAT